MTSVLTMKILFIHYSQIKEFNYLILKTLNLVLFDKMTTQVKKA